MFKIGRQFIKALILPILVSLALMAAPKWGYAQSGALPSIRMMVNTGMMMRNYAVPTSTTTKLVRETWAAGLSYTLKQKWEFGYEWQLLPRISFTPWVFTDNSTGAYTAKYFQHSFLLGYVFQADYRIRLLFGFETMPWAGTPTLGYTDSKKWFYGGAFSWDYYKSDAVGLFAGLRWLAQAQRTYEFANFADDTLIIPKGNQFELQLGGYLAFW